jgi:hypothetical protein
VNDDLGFANAFACRFQQTARPVRRFENEDSIAAACL